MAIATKLERLLDENGVDYEVIQHEPVYTAQEEAAASHISGRAWAKTVVLFADGEPTMAVLPATRKVDERAFRDVAGADRVRLAEEDEFASLYDDCEPGAMPPFGSLYGQPTFVDESLRQAERIAFHAGDHETAVEMAYADWESLAEAVPGAFSERLEP